jgi:hypothetical protein
MKSQTRAGRTQRKKLPGNPLLRVFDVSVSTALFGLFGLGLVPCG